MKDNLIEKRIKSRFILEIRYKPLTKLFDQKGKIISKIHPIIKDSLPHWRVTEGNILFVDEPNNHKNEAHISLHRFGLSIEDSVSLVKFNSFLKTFIYEIYEMFSDDIKSANRIGFRILSVLKKDDLAFHDIKDDLINRMINQPLPINIEATDLKLVINYNQGFYSIGPVRRGEQWLKDTFKNPEIECDGYGIDIDSFIQEVKIGSKKKLEEAINAVFDLSKGNEEQLAKYCELI